MAGGSDPIPGMGTGGGGGIQFDTSPQSGGYLVVSSTGAHSGSGILLETDDTGTLDLNSANSISMYDTGGGGIYITSVAGGEGGSFVGIASDGELFLHGDVIANRMRTGGQWEVQDAGAHISAYIDDDGYVFHRLKTGSDFSIQDHSSNQLFKVTDGASIELATFSSGNINLTSDNQINASGPGAVGISSTGSVITAYGKTGIYLEMDDPSAQLKVYMGASVVFRIDVDGSLHGATGKSLVFDL